MEIFKKIIFLVFLISIFIIVAGSLQKIITSNNVTGKWYDSTNYLNEYYLADSRGNYDTGTGNQYYLTDSKKSLVENSGSLAYAGSVYYDSGYNTYSGGIYKQYTKSDTGYQYYKESDQYSYDDPNAGYRYFKKYKDEDGFDDAWDEYLDNN